MKELICLLLLSTMIVPLHGQVNNCDHFIDSTQVYVDATNMGVEPGDTICLECGHRPFLQLKNFEGDSLNYITIINYGGQVVIQNDTFYGFVLNHCKYFHLTGTGYEGMRYGIKVGGTGPGASGLSLDNLSTNFEVDHVEVCNTGFAGIMSKTNPRCDRTANRGYFTQYNTIFHDNYVHHTGGEGFYIGHSYYNGWPTTCDGQPDTLFPHDIVGLRVFNNRIDSVDYDGLQIDCAVEDCEVYDNLITNYGLADNALGLYYGMTGIVIGGGSTGRYYNNIMTDGKGSGIFVFGLGNCYVFNNLIVKPGRTSQLVPGPPDHHHPYGIFCDDRTTIPGESFNFINNTIISPRDIGIRIWSLLSSGNRVYNNFILDPGVKDWNIPRAFIDVIGPQGNADTLSHNNHLDSTALAVAAGTYFVFSDTGNYHTRPGSPLIDSGIAVDSVQNITFDLDFVPRPQGAAYDIGVYEFPALPGSFGLLPQNPERCEGENIMYQVDGIYTPMFSFQWMKDDEILPGETDTILQIEPIHYADQGNYNCILSNGFDSDTSLPSFLTVQKMPDVYAGDDTLICINVEYLDLFGAASDYSDVLWSSTGDGVFEDETQLQTKYYPGEEDKETGFVQLVLTASAIAPCSGSVDDTLNLTIDPCTYAHDSKLENQLILFPNPADKNLFIRMNDIPGKGHIIVYSSMGRMVFYKELDVIKSPLLKIDTQKFLPGLYYVKFENNPLSVVEKVMIF